jgi:hypothetical protein
MGSDYTWLGSPEKTWSFIDNYTRDKRSSNRAYSKIRRRLLGGDYRLSY